MADLRRLNALAAVVLVLFTPALLSAASAEGRWKLIGQSKTGTQWYIDAGTIAPSGDIVAVWVKSIPEKTSFEPERNNEKTEDILKRIQAKYFGHYEFTEGLWELDCARNAFRLLYFCAYDKEGGVVASSLTPDAEWSFVIPGSAGETLREALCR